MSQPGPPTEALPPADADTLKRFPQEDGMNRTTPQLGQQKEALLPKGHFPAKRSPQAEALL